MILIVQQVQTETKNGDWGTTGDHARANVLAFFTDYYSTNDSDLQFFSRNRPGRRHCCILGLYCWILASNEFKLRLLCYYRRLIRSSGLSKGRSSVARVRLKVIGENE